MKTVSRTTVGGADFGRQRGTFQPLLLSAGHFQFSDATLVSQPDDRTPQVLSNQINFTCLTIAVIVELTGQIAAIADVDVTATAEIQLVV